MKKINLHSFSIFYSLLTLLGTIAWIPFPDLGHYLGAASIVESLVFCLTRESKLGFLIAAILWLVFVVALTITLFRACINQTYRLLPILMLIDILLSIFLVVYKIATENYFAILHMLFGLALRGVILCFFFQLQRRNNTD